jgi:hypothetical protein
MLVDALSHPELRIEVRELVLAGDGERGVSDWSEIEWVANVGTP